MPSREITKLTDSFPALRNDPALMLEVFQENLGGETIGSRDLDNIKIPSGGGTSWEVPSIDGGIAAKTIEGVVVQHGLRRAYWASRKVTNQPPQCRSDNSRDAIGDPGSNLGPNRDGVGACLECPLAEFGTGVDENGQANNSQACKQMRQVFFLMSDGLLPRVVTLPPTSLAVSKTFFLQLANNGIPYHHAVVELSLEKQSGGQYPYSVARWKLVRIIADDEQPQLDAYRAAILPMLAARPVTGADYASSGA
jgi:hypothetical protein